MFGAKIIGARVRKVAAQIELDSNATQKMLSDCALLSTLESVSVVAARLPVPPLDRVIVASIGLDTQRRASDDF